MYFLNAGSRCNLTSVTDASCDFKKVASLFCTLLIRYGNCTLTQFSVFTKRTVIFYIIKILNQRQVQAWQQTQEIFTCNKN